jgi:glycosyltransferase involved in cell wall biosynthesis
MSNLIVLPELGTGWIGGDNYLTTLRMGLENLDTKGAFTIKSASEVSQVSAVSSFQKIFELPWPTLNIAEKKIFWLPDFQHLELPHYFSLKERSIRHFQTKKRVWKGSSFYFSSQTSQEFAHKNYKNLKSLGIVRFALKPEANSGLDETFPFVKFKRNEYFYLPNQWWKHKNHLGFLSAYSRYLTNGGEKHLVLTGTTADYRWPKYEEHLNLLVNRFPTVHNLGLVPRNVQLTLFKNAFAIVQPSLYEGWSTSIEEAIHFNKKLIISNIPNNVEQTVGLSGVHLFDVFSEDSCVEALFQSEQQEFKNREDQKEIRWNRFLTDLENMLLIMLE